MHDPSDWTNSPEELPGALPDRPAPTAPDLVIPPKMLAAGEEYELNVIGTPPERPALATEGERTVLGALARFQTLTEGAMREFRVSIRNRTSDPWAAAVKLRNTCEDAGLELRRTLERHDTPRDCV